MGRKGREKNGGGYSSNNEEEIGGKGWEGSGIVKTTTTVLVCG